MLDIACYTLGEVGNFKKDFPDGRQSSFQTQKKSTATVLVRIRHTGNCRGHPQGGRNGCQASHGINSVDGNICRGGL